MSVGILGLLSALTLMQGWQLVRQSQDRDRTMLAACMDSLQALAPAGRERFEYRIEAPPDYIFARSMNGYGAAGWELVSARRATTGYGYATDASYEVLLMRRLPSNQTSDSLLRGRCLGAPEAAEAPQDSTPSRDTTRHDSATVQGGRQRSR